MADGAVVGPYAENPRTKYLQTLANLLDDSLGTSDYYAIAFDHCIPARGVDTAIKRVRPQCMFVLLQQPFRTLARVVSGRRHKVAGQRYPSHSGITDEKPLAGFNCFF